MLLVLGIEKTRLASFSQEGQAIDSPTSANERRRSNGPQFSQKNSYTGIYTPFQFSNPY